MIESFNGYRRNDDYLRDVARGGVVGAYPYGSYGEKTTVGADSGLLWPNGAFSFPSSSGVQVSFVSTSASDDAAGTGIRTLDMHYLDTNLVERVESIVLDGVTPVLSVATNVRFIQCLHAVTFGSGKAAAGVISASNGAATYSQINTGAVRCSSSLRMVPAGKRLVITSMYAGSVSGTAAAKTTVRLATPNFDGHDYTTSSIFFPLFAGTFQDNSSGLTIPCPLAFTEGQSIGMTFECDKAATVVGSWFGWMENI